MFFPGGIGQGRLCAEAFCYRGRVRIDVCLAHNRVFARPDGSPSDRRLYLNDFVASTTLDADQEDVPDAFVQHVLDGVARARAALRRGAVPQGEGIRARRTTTPHRCCKTTGRIAILPHRYCVYPGRMTTLTHRY